MLNDYRTWLFSPTSAILSRAQFLQTNPSKLLQPLIYIIRFSRQNSVPDVKPSAEWKLEFFFHGRDYWPSIYNCIQNQGSIPILSLRLRFIVEMSTQEPILKLSGKFFKEK